MILPIVRMFFLLVVLAITVSFAFIPEVYGTGQEYITYYILIPVVLALGLVLADTFWHQKRLQVLSGLFFGVLAGLAIAYMLSLIVDLIVGLLPAPPPAQHPGPPPRFTSAASAATQPATSPALAATSPAASPADIASARREHEGYSARKDAYNAYTAHAKTIQMIKLLLATAAVFLCVTFVLQTKDDFRFVIPYVEFTKQTKGARQILLDTSVIIDGRIADIAETRIIESEVVVPRFVLGELQAIADSDDKLKRNRGRRGLDILNRLQNGKKMDIRLLDAHVASVDDAADVDAKLVALAKHMDARIITNDYNLNKVAQLRGVDVININDLANALKPVVLPGEAMTVKVIKPGEEPGQGIGYLEDGTMVVAEQGRDFIGKEIVITVTSVLQTSAGRMIFGRLDGDKTFGRHRNHSVAAGPAGPAAPGRSGGPTGPAQT